MTIKFLGDIITLKDVKWLSENVKVKTRLKGATSYSNAHTTLLELCCAAAAVLGRLTLHTNIFTPSLSIYKRPTRRYSGTLRLNYSLQKVKMVTC